MKRLEFRDKKILITGGLGFIGSNIAHALVLEKAQITIIDNRMPQQGGNLYNIAAIKNDIDIHDVDIRDIRAINKLVKGQDYIFHLARQTDHILSLTDPFPDIDINVRGTAILLEACKRYNPSVRFIYAGTRGQYGHAVKLPVAETAPTNPRGIYEITNLTAEKMVHVYHDVHKIQSIMLRLTNIYGPRSQMKHDHYGVVNWFIRLALENKVIPVFGDGALKRDFLYIDDAIDAILVCASTKRCYGEIINIGNNKAETFLSLVKLIIATAQSGSWRFTDFTKERKAQEPGDFTSDIRKIKRLTRWKPKTSLASGIKKTIDFYKAAQSHYW